MVNGPEWNQIPSYATQAVWRQLEEMRDGMSNPDTLPTWAPRVSQSKIRQPYETDAQGIYDDELIDEVGYGLLTRCESFIAACEAIAGRIHCPRCGTLVTHNRRKKDILLCDCGWKLTWGEYFKTIQGSQLNGAEPVLELFRTFIKDFTASRTAQEKMLAIARVIHGFHYSMKTGAPSRPVAVNLIEGQLRKVVVFLDQLTYSDKGSPGTQASYLQWRKNIDGQDWDPSKDS